MKKILSILFLSIVMMFSAAYATEYNDITKMKNTAKETNVTIAKEIHLAISGTSDLLKYVWKKKIINNGKNNHYEQTATNVTIDAAFSTFCYTESTASDPQSLTVAAVDLTGDLVVNVPTGFEIMIDGDISYSPSLTITNSGIISPTTLLVRVSSSASGSLSGNIDFTVSSDGINETLGVSANASQIWYEDSDGDTFGNSASSTQSCSQPTGYVSDNTDCDDNDINEFPGQTWYIDADGDDYGGSSTTACERPTDGYILSELAAGSTGTDDCDDNDINEFPGQTWYIDADGDDYGGSSTTACERPTDGYILSELAAGSTGTDDCDDNDINEFPGQTWYIDADGDDYGGSSTTACERPTDGYILSELAAGSTGTDDCDDNDVNEFPGQTWYIDADGDDYGGSSTTACERPTDGYILSELAAGSTGTDDCDDNDINEFPGQTWYIDADGDDYGGSSTTACERPTDGFILSELAEGSTGTDDCDDNDINEFPGQTWYIDADGDDYGGSSTTACERPENGHLLSELVAGSTGTDDCIDNDDACHPLATEVPGNLIDENCDGVLAGLPTYLTVNSPHSFTYSDPEDNSKPIRIHITDENGDPLPDGTEVSIVAYNQRFDGTQYYGSNTTSDPITLIVAGGQGFAETASKLSDLFPLLDARKIEKQEDPASWPRAYIYVSYAGEDGFYDPSERTASIVVRRENGNFVPLGVNAETDKIKFNGIAGSGYIVTSNTSENVKFTVKIADIADGYPGDINKAKVKFVLNPAGTTQETVLYDTDGFVDGMAEATFNVSCGTLGANPYNVQVFLEGNYRGRLNTTLTMHKTNSTEVISAGGDIQILGSKGLYAGTDGSVVRFGFGAKYNKTATNVQGKATLIFVNRGRTYQVTGNGTPIITMDATTGLATYNTKASITDITSDGADATVSSITSPSGLRMEFTMTDAIPDILSVRVYDASTTANTLWFSNKGTGSTSDKQSLTRGGITVKAQNTGTKTGGKKEVSNVSAEMMNESMIARIIPNPSTTDFTLFTSGDGNEKIQVRLMDISGRLLKQYDINSGSTLKFGQELRNGMYIVQMIQNGKSDVFRIVKQQ